MLICALLLPFHASAVVETDSNAETLHWLEVMQLMQEVYSQPRSLTHAHMCAAATLLLGFYPADL